MNQIKIAETLKALRKERQLTQEELAEKLNVSAKTVSRWETGRNLPDVSVLVELADFYQVDIRDIILCKEGQGKVNDEFKDVASKVADYSAADKEATAKRTIIASVTGIVAFVAAILLMVFGSGIFSFLAIVSFAVVFGCLCYVLMNSTQKYTEANRKRTRWTMVLNSILISVAFLILFLTAVTATWFSSTP